MKFILIGIIFALILYIIYLKNTMKSINYKINEMLDLAIREDFNEKNFDESELSKIESKFYRYLLDTKTKERKLLQQKKNIEVLISDISHQSKTPLANIILYSQLLDESHSIEYVDEINFQSKKLKFLIENLIKLSRLESGIIKLNPSINSVNGLIKNIIGSSLIKAEEKGISIIFTEVKDYFAFFDFKWTEEALYNIVDNGIKYSLEDEDIHINLVDYPIFHRIDIINKGIGIAEEEINRIFQRFYRGKNVSGEEGVGIGLYLSREIIEAGGGYIQVKSSIQETMFSIFLPKDKKSI